MHPSSSSSSFHLLTQRWRGTLGEPLCARVLCVSLLLLHPRVLSVSGAGARGGKVRDSGGCRTEDAAGAGAKGTPGAGGEQHVPGQVTLCHPQRRVLGKGGRSVHTVLSDTPPAPSWTGSHCFGCGLLLMAGPLIRPVPAAHPRPSQSLPQQDTGSAFCLPCPSSSFLAIPIPSA